MGPPYFGPRIGFGGFCFPRDLQAFVKIGERFNCDLSLFKEVEEINLRRIEQLVKKVKDRLWVIHGKKIALWGLAFKPNTDDIRYSPSLAIIRRLLVEGAGIQAYGPQAIGKAMSEIPESRYCEDPYLAAEGIQAILALTEWDEFREIEWDRVRSLVARPLIFDGRNMFPKANVVTHGFANVGIGKIEALALADWDESYSLISGVNDF